MKDKKRKSKTQVRHRYQNKRQSPDLETQSARKKQGLWLIIAVAVIGTIYWSNKKEDLGVFVSPDLAVEPEKLNFKDKKLDDRMVRALINQYLDTQQHCVTLTLPVTMEVDPRASMYKPDLLKKLDYLTGKQVLSARDHQVSSGIESASGYITETNVDGRTYSLAYGAQHYYNEKNKALCFAQPRLDRLMHVGSPEKKDNFLAASITYQYSYRLTASWAEHREAGLLFLEVKKAQENQSTSLEASETIVLGKAGWVHFNLY